MVTRLFKFYYYLIMKKTLLFATLLAASFTWVSAQEVLRYYGRTFVVPSALSFDGEPRFVVVDDQQATIYNPDFSKLKSINLNTEKRVGYRYNEIAYVFPSSARIVNESTHQNGFEGADVSGITTPAEFQKWFEEQTNITGQHTGFMDYKGRISCVYRGDAGNFHLPSLFGEKYPSRYFAIENDSIIWVGAEYENDFSINMDSLQWEKGEVIETVDYSTEPIRFEYIDYDNYYESIQDLQLTQKLFNKDEKWEYIIPKYGALVKEVGDSYYEHLNARDTITERYYEFRRYKRPIYETPSKECYAICDEDGNEVATLDVKEDYIEFFMKLGYNLYLQTSSYDDTEGQYVEILYKFNPKTTSIEEVSRSAVSTAVVRMNGRNIIVEADGQDVDEAVLFDMGGRKMASSGRHSAGNITLNASQTSAGVYTVALKKRGRMVGAQKIMLK